MTASASWRHRCRPLAHTTSASRRCRPPSHGQVRRRCRSRAASRPTASSSAARWLPRPWLVVVLQGTALPPSCAPASPGSGISDYSPATVAAGESESELGGQSSDQCPSDPPSSEPPCYRCRRHPRGDRRRRPRRGSARDRSRCHPSRGIRSPDEPLLDEPGPGLSSPPLRRPELSSPWSRLRSSPQWSPTSWFGPWAAPPRGHGCRWRRGWGRCSAYSSGRRPKSGRKPGPERAGRRRHCRSARGRRDQSDGGAGEVEVDPRTRSAPGVREARIGPMNHLAILNRAVRYRAMVVVSPVVNAGSDSAGPFSRVPSTCDDGWERRIRMSASTATRQRPPATNPTHGAV